MEDTHLISQDVKVVMEDTHLISQDVKVVMEDTHQIGQDVHVVMEDTHQIDQNVMFLIKDTHHFPTLAVILPLDLGSTLWERRRCRLVFMCSHTRKLVPCGDTPEKNGFLISVTSEWVKQVAPFVQCGLSFLGSGMGDAILRQLYPDSTMLQAVLKSALSMVGSSLSTTASSAIALQPHQEFLCNTPVLEEGSRAAHDAMRSILADKDIASTGLVQETADGHTAWIKNDPEVIQSFHDRKGRRLEYPDDV
mmetsp:Transcript_12450/g.17012  ORF Transcript_12450/g.17012 Transcript_12450/m.17012 type:complete len:250 (-) Transcript_12450:124-873(-)